MPLATAGGIVGDARSAYGLSGKLGGDGLRIPLTQKRIGFAGTALTDPEKVDQMYRQYPRIRRTFQQMTTMTATQIKAESPELSGLALELGAAKTVDEVKQVFKSAVQDNNRAIDMMSGQIPSFTVFAPFRVMLRGAALGKELERERVLVGIRDAEAEAMGMRYMDPAHREGLVDDAGMPNVDMRSQAGQDFNEIQDRNIETTALRTKDWQIRVLRKISRTFTRTSTAFVKDEGQFSRNHIQIGDPMSVDSIANLMRGSKASELEVEQMTESLLSNPDPAHWINTINGALTQTVLDQILRTVDYSIAPQVVMAMKPKLIEGFNRILNPGNIHAGENGVFVVHANADKAGKDSQLAFSDGTPAAKAAATDSDEVSGIRLPEVRLLNRMIKQTSKEMRWAIRDAKDPGSELEILTSMPGMLLQGSQMQTDLVALRTRVFQDFKKKVSNFAENAKENYELAKQSKSALIEDHTVNRGVSKLIHKLPADHPLVQEYHEYKRKEAAFTSNARRLAELEELERLQGAEKGSLRFIDRSRARIEAAGKAAEDAVKKSHNDAPWSDESFPDEIAGNIYVAGEEARELEHNKIFGEAYPHESKKVTSESAKNWAAEIDGKNARQKHLYRLESIKKRIKDAGEKAENAERDRQGLGAETDSSLDHADALHSIQEAGIAAREAMHTRLFKKENRETFKLQHDSPDDLENIFGQFDRAAEESANAVQAAAEKSTRKRFDYANQAIDIRDGKIRVVGDAAEKRAKKMVFQYHGKVLRDQINSALDEVHQQEETVASQEIKIAEAALHHWDRLNKTFKEMTYRLESEGKTINEVLHEFLQSHEYRDCVHLVSKQNEIVKSFASQNVSKMASLEEFIAEQSKPVSNEEIAQIEQSQRNQELAMALGKIRASKQFMRHLDNMVHEMFSPETFEAYGDKFAHVDWTLENVQTHELISLLKEHGELDAARNEARRDIDQATENGRFRAERRAQRNSLSKLARFVSTKATPEEQDAILVKLGRQYGVDVRYATGKQVGADLLDEIINNKLLKPLALSTFGWAERVSLSELFLNAARVGPANILRSFSDAHAAKRAWKLDQGEMGHLHAAVTSVLLGFHNGGFRSHDRQLLWEDALDLIFANEGHIAHPGVSAIHGLLSDSADSQYHQAASAEQRPGEPGGIGGGITTNGFTGMDASNKRWATELAHRIMRKSNSLIAPKVAKILSDNWDKIIQDLSEEGVENTLRYTIEPLVEAEIRKLPKAELARYDRSRFVSMGARPGADPIQDWARVATSSIWHTIARPFEAFAPDQKAFAKSWAEEFHQDANIKNLIKGFGSYDPHSGLRGGLGVEEHLRSAKEGAFDVKHPTEDTPEKNTFYFPHKFLLDAINNKSYLDETILKGPGYFGDYGVGRKRWIPYAPTNLPARETVAFDANKKSLQRAAEIGHRRFFGPLVNYLSRDPIFLHEYHREMGILRSGGKIAGVGADTSTIAANHFKDDPNHRVSVFNTGTHVNQQLAVEDLGYELDDSIQKIKDGDLTTHFDQYRLEDHIEKMQKALSLAEKTTGPGKLLVSRNANGELTGIAYVRHYSPEDKFTYREQAPRAFSSNRDVHHVESLGHLGGPSGASESLMHVAARQANHTGADLTFHQGEDAASFFNNFHNRYIGDHVDMQGMPVHNITHATLKDLSKPINYDDLALIPSKMTHEHASQIAQTRAMYHMIQFVHNPQEKTMYDQLFRIIAPFYFAQNQALKRVLRTIGENPGALPYYIQSSLGFNDMMTAAADQNGFVHWMMPGSFLAGGLIGNTISQYWDLKTGALPIGLNMMPTSLATVDPAAEVTSAHSMGLWSLIMPKFGPIVGIADHIVRGAINMYNPKFRVSKQSKMMDTVEGPFMPSAPLWMQLVPSAFLQGLIQSAIGFGDVIAGKQPSDILNGKFAQVDIEAQKTIVHNRLEYEYNRLRSDPAYWQGVMKTEATPGGQAEMKMMKLGKLAFAERSAWADASDATVKWMRTHADDFTKAHTAAAAGLFFLKSIVGWLTPTSESLAHYGVDWNQVYLGYQKKYGTDQLADFFLPFQKFCQDHPGELPYVTRTSTTPQTMAFMPSATYPSLSSIEPWIDKNVGIVLANPGPARYLIDSRLTNRNDPNNAYSSHMGQVLGALKLKSRFGPQDFTEQMMISLGDGARDMFLQPQLDYMKANNFSKTDIWTQEYRWLKSYGNANPAFIESYGATTIDNNADRVINDIPNMLNRPELKQAFDSGTNAYNTSGSLSSSLMHTVDGFEALGKSIMGNSALLESPHEISVNGMGITMGYLYKAWQDYQKFVMSSPNQASAARKQWQAMIDLMVIKTATDPNNTASSPYFNLLILFKTAK